jgi:anti-anti-sigma factor
MVDTRTGAACVTIIGDVDIGVADEFEDALLAAWDDVGRPVAVDLRGVDFFDASALHALIVAWRVITSRGGEIFIAAASPPVLRVLAITGTDTLLVGRTHPAPTSAAK